MIKFLCLIQARYPGDPKGRFPGKVLQTVHGRTLVKRVWDAAKGSKADMVKVAWPERYPDLDQNDVRERFRRISNEFPSRHIIRLTADCPLLTSAIIDEAIKEYNSGKYTYYCNRDRYPDGFDVQIFTSFMLHRDYNTHKEHVIRPKSNFVDTHWLSVDTRADLERVRMYASLELK